MCYEFVHACESVTLDQIKRMCQEHFFLVCIRHLNYFYCEDALLVGEVKQLLSNKGIDIYKLSATEMAKVIYHPATAVFQVFSGNRILFEQFQERCQL